MKEKELYIDSSFRPLIYFVEKEDKSFGAIESGSQIVTEHLDDYLSKMKYFEDQEREKLIRGENSSIAFYMNVQNLTLTDLASRAGVSKRKLKKHKTCKGFGNITVSQLKKYSEIFGVGLEDLFTQIIVEKEGRDAFKVSKSSTANPNFSFIKVQIEK
jgi:hypothetical protein